VADETTQGTHPFTVAWWQSLPTTYRKADRVQGYRLNDAWHGLNRDPRFITGWDKWYRLNISTKPWMSAVSFTRSFRATPNIPVHIRSWHHPVTVNAQGQRVSQLNAARIRHIVRNYTGDVIADATPGGGDVGGSILIDAGSVVVGDENIYDGGGVSNPPADGDPNTGTTDPTLLELLTVVTPDRFGVLQVTIQVEIDVPNARNLMDAIHVGVKDAKFQDLPALDYFTTAAAYPLLRYMDGIGHQAGYLSDAVNDIHDGKWTDPATAPEFYLPFLASVLGVPRRYSDSLTAVQLRQHLVDMVEGNAPIPGSREHIVIAAKQWLTGSKEVSVVPAHTIAGYSGGDAQHTLIITAKASEVPGNNLAAFAAYLNDSGVIPAGHRIITREGTPTWDAWQTASGTTWDQQAAKIRTWNDSDSAGVTV
jgi:hypothetical protein